MILQLDDIRAAEARIRPYLRPTPVERVPILDDGGSVWLKLENVNPTHSFKVRGALNAMLQLDEAARTRGIVAASTGNHAQGIAWAAGLLGLKATIVMPETASRRKITNVRRLGGEAVLVDGNYDVAEAEARRLEREQGMTYISAYNDVRVMAGGGTVALEILEAVPNAQRIIVPIGGGGLISGIGTAVKALRPDIELIGVNAAASPVMYNHFYGLDLPDKGETLADSLPGAIEAGSLTIDLAQEVVDRVLLASEFDVARAIRWLVYEAGWVGEGGGVAGVAVILNEAIPLDRETVVVISGGNIDGDTLGSVLTD